MVAAADPADGKKVVASVPSVPQVGRWQETVLARTFGVVDREIASVEGFRYSKRCKTLTGMDRG